MKPTISANIVEAPDGAYFPVLLHAIPRVGETIKLYSHLDASTGHEPNKVYNVVRIEHQMHDVSEKIPMSKDGHHFVTIYVRPA
jgi:hypothetical protein